MVPLLNREVNFSLGSRPDVFLALRNPDLTTARRIEAVINEALGKGVAQATDPRSVALKLEGHDVVASLAEIEDLRVTPDTPAIVIIDEASGTIVMGANVRISTVAIAQGNLTIRVTENPEVSQPGAFSSGKTVTTQHSSISVDSGSDHKLGDAHRRADIARFDREPECTRRWAARSHQHSSSHQGRWGPASRSGSTMTINATTPIRQSQPSANHLSGRAPQTRAQIEKAAQDFTAVALSEMLSPVFDTLQQDGGEFGGGQARGRVAAPCSCRKSRSRSPATAASASPTLSRKPC